MNIHTRAVNYTMTVDYTHSALVGIKLTSCELNHDQDIYR